MANPNEKYSISSNRPFNKWLSTKIGKIPDFAVSGVNLKHNYGGMFFVHKSRISAFTPDSIDFSKIIKNKE